MDGSRPARTRAVKKVKPPETRAVWAPLARIVATSARAPVRQMRLRPGRLQRTHREALQHRHAFAERGLEVELAIHGTGGDGGDLLLQAGKVRQLVQRLAVTMVLSMSAISRRLRRLGCGRDRSTARPGQGGAGGGQACSGASAAKGRSAASLRAPASPACRWWRRDGRGRLARRAGMGWQRPRAAIRVRTWAIGAGSWRDGRGDAIAAAGADPRRSDGEREIGIGAGPRPGIWGHGDQRGFHAAVPRAARADRTPGAGGGGRWRRTASMAYARRRRRRASPGGAGRRWRRWRKRGRRGGCRSSAAARAFTSWR